MKKDNIPSEYLPYLNLCVAISHQAVDDYRSIVKRLILDCRFDDACQFITSSDVEPTFDEVESFIQSEFYKKTSPITPENTIKQLNKIAFIDALNIDIKEIRKVLKPFKTFEVSQAEDVKELKKKLIAGIRSAIHLSIFLDMRIKRLEAEFQITDTEN